MAWTIFEPRSGKWLDSGTDEALACVWQVVNSGRRRASIEVIVSAHAHLTQLGQEYLDEIQAAKESHGRSEVLRLIADLPDQTKPPRSILLSSNGRHHMK